MKVFLKNDQGVYVQKRDIDFLSDILHVTLKEEQGLEVAKYLQNEEFLLLKEKENIYYLKAEREIVNFFDYLGWNIEDMRDELDMREQLASIRQTVYRRRPTEKNCQKMLYAAYEYRSMLEMYGFKLGLSNSLAFPQQPSTEKDAYGYETTTYQCYETEVEGIYHLARKDGQVLTKEEEAQFYQFKEAVQTQILARDRYQQDVYECQQDVYGICSFDHRSYQLAVVKHEELAVKVLHK